LIDGCSSLVRWSANAKTGTIASAKTAAAFGQSIRQKSQFIEVVRSMKIRAPA
jgi:hypothetical protein